VFNTMLSCVSKTAEGARLQSMTWSKPVRLHAATLIPFSRALARHISKGSRPVGGQLASTRRRLAPRRAVTLGIRLW